MKFFIGIGFSLIIFFSLFYLVGNSVEIFDIENFEEQLSSISENPTNKIVIGIILSFLLVLDLILPIPSSILMVFMGKFFGLFYGSILNFISLMISSLIGFSLCRFFGRKAFENIIGIKDQTKVEEYFEKYGPWAIILSRSVPMFNETISCLSGLTRISTQHFIVFSIIGTLPISIVYAWAGSLNFEQNSLLIPIFTAFILPAIAYGLIRYIQFKNFKLNR